MYLMKFCFALGLGFTMAACAGSGGEPVDENPSTTERPRYQSEGPPTNEVGSVGGAGCAQLEDVCELCRCTFADDPEARAQYCQVEDVCL